MPKPDCLFLPMTTKILAASRQDFCLSRMPLGGIRKSCEKVKDKLQKIQKNF